MGGGAFPNAGRLRGVAWNKICIQSIHNHIVQKLIESMWSLLMINPAHNFLICNTIIYFLIFVSNVILFYNQSTLRRVLASPWLYSNFPFYVLQFRYILM